MELFAINCPTCNARLKVRDVAAIGMILNCPKCGSMVRVQAPPGWEPPPKPPRWQDEVWRGESPAPAGAASTPKVGLSDSSSSSALSSEKIAASAAAAAPSIPSATPSESAAPGAGAASGGWGWWQWSIAGGLPAAALLASVGVWIWLGSSPPPAIEQADIGAPPAIEQEDPSEPTDPEPPPAEAEPPEPQPVVGVPRRWLPADAEAVVSLLPSELLRQPAAANVLGRTASLWQASLERLLGSLAIELGQVERITWSATDLGKLSSGEWLDSGVVVMQLAAPASSEADWQKRGETLDWKLDGVPVRQLAGDAWKQPIALLDKKMIVTGPESVLKGLAERDDHRLTKPGLEELVSGWDARDQLVGALDLTALRRGDAVPAWLPMVDLWHAESDDWQLVRTTPQVAGLSLRFGERFVAELDLVCEAPSSAEQLQATLERVLAAMQTTLSEESEGLTEKLQAGQLDTAGATELKRLLASSETTLAGRHSGVREAVVWFRLDWQGDLPRLSSALLANIPQIEASRLAAARQADEDRHRTLLLGLHGYEKTAGSFPAGAAGAQLLPPETRLSWLATLLPYYDHLDWHEQLNFGRAWNDAANQRVTRRPFELVVNPSLGPATTKAGFPISHYVGVAGMGGDAANLEASDPRAGVFGFRPRPRRDQIPDGASHTIALAGVQKQLGPWASGGAATVRGFTRQPYIHGPDGFGSGQPDGMVVGMADGSVRFLSKDIDPAVLALLVTANGGEPAPEEALAGPAVPLPEADVPREKLTDAESVGEGAMADRAPLLADDDGPSLDDAPAAGDSPAVDVAARLEDRIPAIEYKRTLSGLIELLSQISAVPITLDIEALSAAGIKPDAKVAVKLTDASIGEILAAAIEPYDLRFVIVGQHVVVTDRRRGEEERTSVRYEVGDLASRDSDGPADLVALVTRFVVPTSWQEAGGTGLIEQNDRTLVVEQTASIQQQVADFLDRLRLARGLPAKGRDRPPATLATRSAQAKEKLSAPVTATFREATPLNKIAAHLKDATGVKIVFDGLALAASEASPTMPATLTANQRPLAVALNDLLTPLRLSYRIVDAGTLEITTAREARDELEIEFYPVKERLAGQSADGLIEQIREQIAPDSWDETGGGATIDVDAPSSCLIVSQSQPVQRELEAWLSKQPEPGTGGKADQK